MIITEIIAKWSWLKTCTTKIKANWPDNIYLLLNMWLLEMYTVAARKEPVVYSVEKTVAAESKSAAEGVVFEISAVDRPTIELVKNALRQKAEQMILTVLVPFEELSKQSKDELKSLQCSDVTIGLGKPSLIFHWKMYYM